MNYNFDELIARRGTNSYKWDSAADADVLPMWVADMDFRTAPAITEALRRRVEHGIFGYTRVPQTYYEAVASWFARRHGWSIQTDWMMYTSGVVPALSAIIKALTVPGDKVIAQTPVYNCFFSSIRNNGCELLANPLRREGDTYRMDFDDLECKAADPRAKLLLLCNPHNPAGRVWTRNELARLNDICLRHGVRVVADEIHCELVFSGYIYTPFASVSDACLENSITCVSPSKAFNIAGLQIATIVSSDADIRARIDRAININEVCDVNPFGVIATEAAYSDEGEAWLLQLIAYLEENDRTFRTFCAERLPQFPLVRLEGTYLEWMDCSTLRTPSERLEHDLVEQAHLWLNAGTMYGAEGEGYLRWNIACPRSRMLEGLERFAGFVQS
ncbi:MAG TPA: pyridoxal phosphate-dependent aminotransferase [Candidatus Bacteroides merdipullorum]|uniref:cysteine-S-conjugate beta-lyase n=1 Tax=Candidatus Bacteroides merdipullorum TaxID=2838474 RepID=A0A9D2CX70_9BACE|nr:pyridoxal phosphate-dependent aminotransferase [Candidatus Bacteroides merdipullorum]